MEKIIYRKTLDVHKNGIQFTLQGFETADNLSRCIEINLSASGDTYELPLEGVVALMYITTPDAEEPSIEECTIKDNTIVYDVLPIVEEGITEMQLKLIGTNYDGAKAVLVAPRFAIEVEKSNTEDEDAEQTTTYTALENAVAKASAVYHSRLVRIEFDETCVFRAYYADGSAYESDDVQRYLLQSSTDLNLDSLIKDGIMSFTVSEVADALDGRYRDMFAEAKYVTDLAINYAEPTFVKWDENTINTPYKAGLTTANSGYALVYGDYGINHTIHAWVNGGGKPYSFIHTIVDTRDLGWDNYVSASGDEIASLNIHNPWATLTLSDDTDRVILLEKKPDGRVTLYCYKDNMNHNSLVFTPETWEDFAKSLMMRRVSEGNTIEYNIWGEHNKPYAAQMKHGSYKGIGRWGDGYTRTTSGEDIPKFNSLEFDFRPLAIFVSGTYGTTMFIHGAEFAQVSYGLNSVSLHVRWIDDEENGKYRVEWYVKALSNALSELNAQMNSENVTYYYVAFGK